MEYLGGKTEVSKIKVSKSLSEVTAKLRAKGTGATLYFVIRHGKNVS